MKHLFFALLLLSPLLASAELLWRGDFETGDVSQWSKLQTVSADRIRVVQDPVQEGRHAARIEVRPGDNPINSSGNRNELVYTPDKPEDGEVRWYRWSVLWPSDYRTMDAWQIFTQWHHWIGGGSPPLAFYVKNEEIHLGDPGGEFWSVPLVRGVWREFVVGIRWSVDPEVGWVEIELDGETKLPRTHRQTLLPGTGSVYLKQGLYRSTKVDYQQRLFVDGMSIGTTRESVLPPPPPEPEAPVVEPEEPETEAPETEEPSLPSNPALNPDEEELLQLMAREGCSLPGFVGLLGLAGLVGLRRRRR